MGSIDYYAYFRCDQNNKPDVIKTDMSFELHETEYMADVLIIADRYKLNYDFGIQSFDTKTDSVLEEVDIVSNNYLNN
jgi:hypothetical protein